MDAALLFGVLLGVVFICVAVWVLLLGERRQEQSPKEKIVITEDDPIEPPSPPAPPPR